MFNKRATLERRLRYLERLVYEKSVGRGGPSIAMNMWTFLMDHGPATKEEIDAGLGPRYSNNPTINSYLNAGLITQRGNRYIANPNYNWDDVGVISRDVPPEVLQNIDNLPNSDDIENVDTDNQHANRRGRGRATREPRAPREPRARQIKQNLFSRKLEEVKAAVEAGQDPTAMNDRGKTPLMFACGDPKGQSGEIIEYLLEHGANANDIDGNRPVLSACCKFGDKVGIRALVAHGADIHKKWKNTLPAYIALNEGHIYDSTLVDLIDVSVCRWDSLIHRLAALHINGDISDEVYDTILNSVFKDDSPSSVVYSSDILNELREGKRNLLDLFIRKGEMPQCPSSWRWSFENLGKFGLEAYYEAINLAIEGKLKVKNIRDFLLYGEVFKLLGKDSKALYNIITPEWCRSATYSSLTSAVLNAIRQHMPNVLKVISSSKATKIDYNDIISELCREVPLDITKAACRVLDRCLPQRKPKLSSYTLDDVRRSSNRYLIDFLIDHGYGELIVENLKSLDRLSPECRAAVEDAEIKFVPFDEFDSDMVRQNQDRRRLDAMISRVVDHIEEDEWSREAERYITEHPEILLDEEVTDALEKHPDTATARQLKRRIERMPREKEVYDM